MANNLLSISRPLQFTFWQFLLILFFFLFSCTCEYFYPPSIRSSYYGSYLYRPRRYRSYHGYRGYVGRWGHPTLDRLSSGLIKRAGSHKETNIDNFGYDVEGENDLNKYSEDEFTKLIQDIFSENGSLKKRGFDRLTSGFIRKKRDVGANTAMIQTKHRWKRSTDDKSKSKNTKRKQESTSDDSNEEIKIYYKEREEKESEEAKGPTVEEDELVAPARNKKYFDRLISGFVKKNTDTIGDYELNHDVMNKHIQDTEKNSIDKRMLDRLSPSFVEKDVAYTNTDFDNKGDFDMKQESKRRFDRLTSGFVKKDDDKRYFDRLNSGLVKKPNNKRRLDRLTSGFVKKNIDKRSFDRLTSGFVKKDNDKRYFDRLTSGFVKKAGDKRYFDRLNSAFVRPGDDKRRFDRLNSGFVKKGFDRLTSGFVKKDADKRYFDRLNSGFVKKDDKRRFDRLTSGFVKKDSERRFDRLYSGFVKKTDKKSFDRLTSGFVKRGNYNRDDIDDTNSELIKNDFSEKTVDSGVAKLDSVATKLQENQNGSKNVVEQIPDESNLLKDHISVLSSNTKDGPGEMDYQEENLNKVGYVFMPQNGEQTDFVPILGNAKSDIQKRYFDRLTSGLVKREDINNENPSKRRFDRLLSGFVKRPYSENTYIDRTNLHPVKGTSYVVPGLYASGSDTSDVAERYGEGFPLNRQRRSIYADGRENGYGIDGFKTLLDDYIYNIEKRGLDRLMSGFVKKDFQIRNDVLSKRQSDRKTDKQTRFMY